MKGGIVLPSISGRILPNKIQESKNTDRSKRIKALTSRRRYGSSLNYKGAIEANKFDVDRFFNENLKKFVGQLDEGQLRSMKMLDMQKDSLAFIGEKFMQL